MRPSGPYIVSESDGACVWVHDRGECVARFGKMWYEVFSASEPRRMVAHGSSASVDGWQAFREKVLEVFAHEVENMLAPARFAGELETEPGFSPGEPEFVVRVSRIAEFTNPFREDVWGRGRIRRADVRKALEAGDLAADYEEMARRDGLSPGWDVRRVAYFVKNRDRTPVSIEVISDDGDFVVEDGYHRLAAAIYQGDREIAVGLGGYVRGWDAAFPDRKPLAQEVIDEMAEAGSFAVSGRLLS